MPKRLAVTIAGAVSLGSFEAGVLYELLSGLKRHNENPATSDANRIEIDVLTGASAGGMTATIAAQKLLFDSSALDGAYRNSFYRPWVMDVDLDGLLALQAHEDPSHSIFSSDFVEAISRKYLTQRYGSRMIPKPDPHSAVAETLSLGLALSNLNGVNYTQPTYPSGSFNYTKYQDQFIHEKLTSHDDLLSVWEPLRQAAVACGAFPLAFRMQQLLRHQDEYPNADPTFFASSVEEFVYTDGGVFQNEPLGMAKNLVDNIDDHLDVDSRFYLFVAPGARDATADLTFHEREADYKNAALTLAKSVFQQSRFQDWITAEGVNKQIVLFNDRACELKDAILTNQISPEALLAAATPLLALFFREDPRAQQLAEVRLRRQFPQYVAELAQEPVIDAWVKSILLFETAADLGTRDEMYICSVTAKQSELASSGISAFLGFFDQSYRDHDYDVGRSKAQEDFLNNPPKGLGPLNWQPAAAEADSVKIRAIDHSLDNLPLRQVSESQRREFRDRLRTRAHNIMQEMGANVAVREGVDLFLIKPQLDKLLGL